MRIEIAVDAEPGLRTEDADDTEYYISQPIYQQGGLFLLIYRAVLSQDLGWLANEVISSGG
jgi:hypothetical protein